MTYIFNLSITKVWICTDDINQKSKEMSFNLVCVQGLAMVAKLLPPEAGGRASGTAGEAYGHFVLVPSVDGSLLVKAVATQELLLPNHPTPLTDSLHQDCQHLVNNSLDKVTT